MKKDFEILNDFFKWDRYKNDDEIYWSGVSKDLGEDLILRFIDKIDLTALLEYNSIISEEFIKENLLDKIIHRSNLSEILRSRLFSEEFLITSLNRLKQQDRKQYLRFIKTISFTQKIGPNILREFKEDIDWTSISLYQQLTKDTLTEFREYLFWEGIKQFQSFTPETVELFEDELGYTIDKYRIITKDTTFIFGEKTKPLRGYPVVFFSQRSLILYQKRMSNRTKKEYFYKGKVENINDFILNGEISRFIGIEKIINPFKMGENLNNIIYE